MISAPKNEIKVLLMKPRTALKGIHVQAVPPLGLMYISATLKRAGYSHVRILHPDVFSMTDEQIKAEVAAYQPDVVGLSVITTECHGMESAADMCKAINPDCLLVVGGPHPTGYTDECIQHPSIDVVIRHEGEDAFVAIIEHARQGRSFQSIAGISYKEAGQVHHNPDREYLKDLDLLPFPDWGAINADDYKPFMPQSPFLHMTRYMPILTSRGCPLHCTFCHNVMGKRFRAHSPQRVFDEINTLYHDFHIRDFSISDDTFNWNRQRAFDIMQKIIDSGLDIRIQFPNGVKGDILDEELIQTFARAGVVYLCVAVETASERLQKALKKNLNLDRLLENIRLLAKQRIFTHGYFIFGLPDDSIAEMNSTIKYAMRTQLHTASFFVYHGYRGTELGDTLPDDLIQEVKDHSSIYASSKDFVNCSRVSKKDLVRVRQKANILFYFNPVRIYRIFRDVPNKSIYPILLRKVFSRTLFLKD